MLFQKKYSKIIECVGPETISLKDIINKLLKLINKKRILIPLTIIYSKNISQLISIISKTIITIDQLKLLKYDNVTSGQISN